MTVLRREDVQSRVASWDDGPYRIASSPILTIVPLIIRRLRGPSLSRVLNHSVPIVSLTHRHRCRLKRGPEEAGQLAGDRHRDLGRRLVLFHQAAEAAAQTLLCLVRDRNDPAWLSLASSRERRPDA